MDRMPLAGTAAIKLGIVNNLYPGQETENFWVGQPAFRKLLDEGVAVEQRHGSDIVSVHLCGDDVARLVWPADIQLTFLAHSYGQARQAVRGQPPSPQVAHTVDDGVRAGARGVGFQSNSCRLPSFTEIVQDRFGGELPLHRAHEPAERRFQD